MTGITAFEKSMVKTKEWLKDVREELHCANEEEAYEAMRGVLHALRDRLIPDEAVQLAAQLPMLLQGAYFEGWSLAGKPVKSRTKQDFLGSVSRGLVRQQQQMDPERITQGVFKVLGKHVSEGEIDDVIHGFPPEMRSLWPGTGGSTD